MTTEDTKPAKKVKPAKLVSFSSRIWNEPDLEKKRTIMLIAIGHFAYDTKMCHYIDQVKSMTKGQDVDFLISNLVLWEKGLKVL